MFEDKYMNGLKEMKIIASRFMEETKSTSILELITWIDCKYELQKFEEQQMKKAVRR